VVFFMLGNQIRILLYIQENTVIMCYLVSAQHSPSPNTIEKDEGICLEKSRVHLHGPGHRETIVVVPGRRSDVTKTIENDEGICLEKSRVHLHGPGQRATMHIVPGRRFDVAPGRRSMPEMEINIAEVIAVLGSGSWLQTCHH
jgi:hypothetical protein